MPAKMSAFNFSFALLLVVLLGCGETNPSSQTDNPPNILSLDPPQHDDHSHHNDTQHHVAQKHPPKHNPNQHTHHRPHEHGHSKTHANPHQRPHDTHGHGGHPAHQDKPAEPILASDDALEIFNKRILPIFQSAKPSSCTECHLSGVDLKQYIHPDQAKTFASLAESGLIDKQNPDDSKILTFIRRKPEKPNLITDRVRQQEYAAFRAWIHAAIKEPSLSAAKATEPLGPTIPDEVIRHARKDRVLASFIENVWTEVARCAACHSPDRNQKQVKEHGEQVSWIKLRDPQATMNYMIETDLINPAEPLESLLLTKPTMQVEHGGGKKTVVGDRAYKQFRRFIDDFAAIAGGKYKDANELPEQSDEVSVVSEIWLKIMDIPAKYDKMLLQVDVHRMTDSGWSEFRVATSDRPVFGPKNLWQHSLSLTAPRGSQWVKEINTKRLPAGRYLLKLYLDQQGKLQKDFKYELGEKEFVGEIEVQSRWPSGYGRMTKVRWPRE